MAKDEVVSLNSSLEDSTYMSQSDTGATARVKSGSQYHAQPSFSSHAVEPFFSQALLSPTVGSESHNGFTDSQINAGQMMLPTSSGPSEFGDDGKGTCHTILSPWESTHCVVPGFYQQYPSSNMIAGRESWQSPSYVDSSRPMLQRRSSSHGQQAHSYGVYPPTSLPRMTSQSTGFTSMPLQSTHSPTSSRRQSIASFGQPEVQYMASPDSQWGHSQMVQNHMFTSQVHSYMNSSRSVKRLQEIDFLAANLLYSAMPHNPISSHHPSGASTISANEHDLKDDGRTGQSSTDDIDVRARAHPMYQASPEDDDLYHCPFEKENCPHRPTKLKCNYE